MKSQIIVTLALLGLLGGVFLKGFKEAIGIAVALVALYLALSAVVMPVAIRHVLLHPEVPENWNQALLAQHSSPWLMIGVSLVQFPKLALGLSGFETGVAVMPLIRGVDLATRVRNTRKLLATAALMMSVFLRVQQHRDIVTTLLIEPAKFREGGDANGRALAYLAHKHLGNAFGSLYDGSTMLILAFASASAMAGFLNLIPRYLPRFGMAPEWARAARPLVLVFMVVGTGVTILFRANVGARRSLCHRCSGPDHIRSCRGDNRPMERMAAVATSSCFPGLSLHHRREH